MPTSSNTRGSSSRRRRRGGASTAIFTIDDRRARDAAFGGNIARYINHGCRPNCYVDLEGTHIWIRASRAIRKGEELTYDYNTEGVAGIPCRCRPTCRRVI